MHLAIASGKGGTGKTTVAVNLALSVGAVCLADADVEEPNAHLFLDLPPGEVQVIERQVPEPAADRCTGCGACVRFCRFNALAMVKHRVLVFPELCHACGGCVRVCPASALRERPLRLGQVEMTTSGTMQVCQGRLEVGQPTASPLIRAVLERLPVGVPAIIDAPPGTGCTLVAAVRRADLALLVAEPTPFGRHDLALSVKTLRAVGVPMAVLVNRADPTDRGVQRFCQTEALPILTEIPDDRRIAEAYARGRPLIEALPEYRPLFQRLWQDLLALLATRPRSRRIAL